MALINGHANGITASDIKLARKNGVMSNGTHNGLDNKKPIINFNPGPAKIDPSVRLYPSNLIFVIVSWTANKILMIFSELNRFC